MNRGHSICNQHTVTGNSVLGMDFPVHFCFVHCHLIWWQKPWSWGHVPGVTGSPRTLGPQCALPRAHFSTYSVSR